MKQQKGGHMIFGQAVTFAALAIVVPPGVLGDTRTTTVKLAEAPEASVTGSPVLLDAKGARVEELFTVTLADATRWATPRAALASSLEP